MNNNTRSTYSSGDAAGSSTIHTSHPCSCLRLHQSRRSCQTHQPYLPFRLCKLWQKDVHLVELGGRRLFDPTSKFGVRSLKMDRLTENQSRSWSSHSPHVRNKPAPSWRLVIKCYDYKKNIYIYICVCVCVIYLFIFIYIYLFIHSCIYLFMFLCSYLFTSYLYNCVYNF